jgi:hypothetical protein
MKMRILAGLVATALAALAAVVPFGGCGGSACEPGDPNGGLSCECVGNDCICPSSGDCAILCTDLCDLQCAGSGNCDFVCGAGCLTSCTGAGNCLITVGPGSEVDCTGSGNCDIECEGDCTVSCPGQGTCTVHCAPDAVCEIDQCSDNVQTCPDGSVVCGGGC